MTYISQRTISEKVQKILEKFEPYSYAPKCVIADQIAVMVQELVLEETSKLEQTIEDLEGSLEDAYYDAKERDERS